MADFLLEWGKNPTLRSILKSLGINAPQSLKRDHSPWNASYCPVAALRTVEGASDLSTLVDQPNGTDRIPALLIDARGVTDEASLRKVYEILRADVPRLSTNAHVAMVSLWPDGVADVRTAAMQRGLEGISRSLAKELGGRGATVNLLRTTNNCSPSALAAPLAFFLSHRCAFITGQAITVKNASTITGNLSGKVCLVTGAAGGIGWATAQRMANEGAKVIVADVPQASERAQKLIAGIVGTEFFAIDVTSPEHRETLFAHITSKFGGVDVLVNNAGITRDKTIGKMPPEFWDKLIAVNLTAIFDLTQGLIDRQLLRNNARVINLSSISGIAGNFGQTNYTAAKAALITYGVKLGEQLESTGSTVNAIAPGFIETEMVRTMPATTRLFARRLTSLNQGGRPDDVAEAINFLAQPTAGGINGQVLRVCGGGFLGA